VKRHHRRLGEKSGEQQAHRHDDERVCAMAVERRADLGHVERARACIQHAQGDEHHVAGDAVGDREVDRTLDRRALLDPVGGECVGHRAHQLEEHDQVEQVAGQAEAGHRRQEHQHQAVEQALHRVEIAQRVGERGEHHHRGERGHAGAQGIDRQRDSDRHAVAWRPATEPIGERLVRRMGGEQHAHRDDRCGRGDPEEVLQRPRQHRPGGDQQRRYDERNHDRKGG